MKSKNARRRERFFNTLDMFRAEMSQEMMDSRTGKLVNVLQRRIECALHHGGQTVAPDGVVVAVDFHHVENLLREGKRMVDEETGEAHQLKKHSHDADGVGDLNRRAVQQGRW